MAKTKEQEPEFKIFKTEAPFQVIKKSGKHFITLGNNVVSSKKFDSYTQADKYVKSKPYELIINATCLILEKTKEYAKTTNN